MRLKRGFILLFTLMILMLISLFVVKAMQQTLLYSKAIQQQEKGYHAFYQLEQVTIKLLKNTLLPSCQAQQDEANAIVQSLSRQSACVVSTKKYSYRYFLEDLGEYPCLVVFLNGRFYSTWHQRLSVLQKEKGQDRALLQVRRVRQGMLSECVKNQRIELSLGAISWRSLNF